MILSKLIIMIGFLVSCMFTIQVDASLKNISVEDYQNRDLRLSKVENATWRFIQSVNDYSYYLNVDSINKYENISTFEIKYTYKGRDEAYLYMIMDKDTKKMAVIISKGSSEIYTINNETNLDWHDIMGCFPSGKVYHYLWPDVNENDVDINHDTSMKFLRHIKKYGGTAF